MRTSRGLLRNKRKEFHKLTKPIFQTNKVKKKVAKLYFDNIRIYREVQFQNILDELQNKARQMDQGSLAIPDGAIPNDDYSPKVRQMRT